MIAKSRIVPWGGSCGVRISKNILRAANLAQDDDVQINAKANGVIVISAISPPAARHKHKTIQERFANFNGEIPPLEEADFGQDVGDEIWQ